MFDEGAIVEGLRRRDPRAFRIAYEHLSNRLYGFALRLTGNPARAADVYQDTWLRLAEHAPRLRPDTRLGSWLFTVAHNVWRSERRRGATAGRHEAALALVHDRPSRPDEDAEARAEVTRLEHALMTLPDAHREIFAVLVEGEDLSQRELAQVLGLGHAAFRKRLSRARQALHDAMAESAAPRPSEPLGKDEVPT